MKFNNRISLGGSLGLVFTSSNLQSFIQQIEGFFKHYSYISIEIGMVGVVLLLLCRVVSCVISQPPWPDASGEKLGSQMGLIGQLQPPSPWCPVISGSAQGQQAPLTAHC